MLIAAKIIASYTRMIWTHFGAQLFTTTPALGLKRCPPLPLSKPWMGEAKASWRGGETSAVGNAQQPFNFPKSPSWKGRLRSASGQCPLPTCASVACRRWEGFQLLPPPEVCRTSSWGPGCVPVGTSPPWQSVSPQVLGLRCYRPCAPQQLLQAALYCSSMMAWVRQIRLTESKLNVKYISHLASIKIMCVCVSVCAPMCVYKMWTHSLISKIEQNACFKFWLFC